MQRRNLLNHPGLAVNDADDRAHLVNDADDCQSVDMPSGANSRLADNDLSSSDDKKSRASSYAKYLPQSLICRRRSGSAAKASQLANSNAVLVGEPVYLNVYDMLKSNDYTANLGVGVYHAGIEIYDREYAFGGHPMSRSGIFDVRPRDAGQLGSHFKFKEQVLLGRTEFVRSDIRQIIEQMGTDFRGDTYHLIHKNCNHFADALSHVLTGQPIPAWVNRLAFISSYLPFVQKCLPRELLTPIPIDSESQARDGGDRQQRAGGAANPTETLMSALSFMNQIANHRPARSDAANKSSSPLPNGEISPDNNSTAQGGSSVDITRASSAYLDSSEASTAADSSYINV